MKLAGRWFIIVIALWSTCAVWEGDKYASMASHKSLYWSIVAFIAAVALVLEVRDFVRKPERETE